MTLRRVLLVLSALLAGAVAAFLWQQRGVPAVVRSPSPVAAPPVDAPAPAEPDPIPPAAAVPPQPAIPPGTSTPSAAPPAPGSGLLVPVQGVAPEALSDTFGDARSGERVHEALDIMAPTGTPVLAVADGHVEKLFDSDLGGLTLYQFEPSGRFAYYYAHLDGYAPGLQEGQPLRRGQVIGYVGATGNADPAAPHLHFAVFALGPEREWWRGTPVNPYPLLRGDVR